MSDELEKALGKAIREYVEALDSYHKLVARYVSVFWEGRKSSTPEPITEAALKELREAEAKVAETHKKWEDALKMWQLERQG